MVSASGDNRGSNNNTNSGNGNGNGIRDLTPTSGGGVDQGNRPPEDIESGNDEDLSKVDLDPRFVQVFKDFIAKEPEPGTTSFVILEKHGEGKGPESPDFEAYETVNSFTREALLAKRTLIPRIQDQIEMLHMQEDELNRKIMALRKAFCLEDENTEDMNHGSSVRHLTNEQKVAFKEAINQAERDLLKTVIGQHDAIPAVLSPLRNVVTGVADPERPLASLFFVGGTGLGKTLTAKTLSKSLANVAPGINFDYLQIDCGEFQGKHEVSSRLLGAPPGYVGYDQGGLLDPIKDNPYHVIVFDEIEKANPALHQLMLQLLESGEATMANGDKIDARNCIIIMTSNVGTDSLERAMNPIGLVRPDMLSDTEVEVIINGALEDYFPPEFRNRIDETVYFQQLTVDDFKTVARLEVQKVIERTQKFNHTHFYIDDEVYDFLVEKGASTQYGARNMRRTVQQYIAKAIAAELYHHDLEKISASNFRIMIYEGHPAVVLEPRAPSDSSVEDPVLFH